MSFQIIVVSTALVILILILTTIGYALYNHNKNLKFPPVTGDCPDYWVSKDTLCTNPKKLGNCHGSKNFNTKHFKGHDGECAKSQWAKNCGLTWQGITTNPKICDYYN